MSTAILKRLQTIETKLKPAPAIFVAHKLDDDRVNVVVPEQYAGEMDRADLDAIVERSGKDALCITVVWVSAEDTKL